MIEYFSSLAPKTPESSETDVLSAGKEPYGVEQIHEGVEHREMIDGPFVVNSQKEKERDVSDGPAEAASRSFIVESRKERYEPAGDTFVPPPKVESERRARLEKEDPFKPAAPQENDAADRRSGDLTEVNTTAVVPSREELFPDIVSENGEEPAFPVKQAETVASNRREVPGRRFLPKSAPAGERKKNEIRQSIFMEIRKWVAGQDTLTGEHTRQEVAGQLITQVDEALKDSGSRGKGSGLSQLPEDLFDHRAVHDIGISIGPVSIVVEQTEDRKKEKERKMRAAPSQEPQRTSEPRSSLHRHYSIR